MFRHQTLQAKLASLPKQIRPDLSLLKGTEEDPLRPAGEEPGKIGLAHRKRKPAQIIAVHGEHVEGAELHLVIVFAATQGIEIGYAVHAQDHGLTIDDELLLPVFQRGLDNPRKAAWSSRSRRTGGIGIHQHC